MIALDVLLIIFLFFLFAFSHTWLASRKLKKALAEKIGTRIAFYRIFYNITSVMFFIVFYSLAPKPDVIIYDLQYPFDLITFALQVLSLAGLIWSARQTDLKEFIGIKQLERFWANNYSPEDLDEKQELKLTGAFKLVRHPIYMFSIMFLLFRPQMNLFYLTTFICIIMYFYIGSVFEEKKLVDVFGEQYKEYQKNVPRLFPIKIFNRQENK